MHWERRRRWADSAALSVLPPGVEEPSGQGPTAPSSGYPKYNIFLIMVDQMRNPYILAADQFYDYSNNKNYAEMKWERWCRHD